MRKKTIRQMSTESRKLARLINDLDSVSRRLKNYLPTVQRLELDSRALKNHKCPLPNPDQKQAELFPDDGK